MSEQYLDTQNEINTKIEILKRIVDLCRRVFNELNKLRSQPMTNERLKEAGENIAALTNEFVLGIGPQTALDIDSVNFGVSRNDSDAVSEENTEEGSELTNPNVDITIRKLCEMVIKLLEEIVQSGHHIIELKETSASRENELVSKLKKCEADLKSENEEKEKIQKQLSESNQEECERLRRENQSHMDEIHRFESEKKDLNERVTAQQNEILEHENRVKALEAILADLSRIIHNLLMKNKESSILCKKLLDSHQKLFCASETHQPGNPLPELDQGDENRQLNDLVATSRCDISQRDRQIRELGEKLEEYVATNNNLREQNIAGRDFAERLLAINRELNDIQRTTNHQVADLDQTNTIDGFRAQVSAKEDTMAAMKDRLKTCEADLKNEHEEKEKIQKQLNESNQESERLRRENQSHMATIRRFESEIERMNKLLNEKNKSSPNIGLPFGQPLGSSVPQSFFRDRRQSPQTLMIKCSYCSRSYPYHLFEGHVQDCMEDSLYMDD